MNKQLIRYAIIAIVILAVLIPLEWAMSSRNEVLAAPTPTTTATQVAQLASLQVLTATATLTQTVLGADPTKPPATVTTPVSTLQVPAMTPTPAATLMPTQYDNAQIPLRGTQASIEVSQGGTFHVKVLGAVLISAVYGVPLGMTYKVVSQDPDGITLAFTRQHGTWGDDYIVIVANQRQTAEFEVFTGKFNY